jgi:hypothetical protein
VATNQMFGAITLQDVARMIQATSQRLDRMEQRLDQQDSMMRAMLCIGAGYDLTLPHVAAFVESGVNQQRMMKFIAEKRDGSVANFMKGLSLAESRAQNQAAGRRSGELVKKGDIGERVQRGRDWNYADQDGGAGCLGTITRQHSEGYAWVTWDGGPKAHEERTYFVGHGGKFHLQYA